MLGSTENPENPLKSRGNLFNVVPDTEIGCFFMRKSVFLQPLVWFAFWCGLVMFSSCEKDDEDDKGTASGTNVIDMGWVEWSLKDMNGNVLDEGKQAQLQEAWVDDLGWMDIYLEKQDGYIGFSFEARTVSLPLKLSKGTFDVIGGHEDWKTYTDLQFELELWGSWSFRPCENQKHTITNVEKVGRSFNGNYLYAVEGNFDIKIDDSRKYNYSSEYLSESEELKEYRLASKYRMIVESDYFAENQ